MPSYIMLLYINLVDPLQSAYHYAAYIVFVQFGGKTYFSNFGINFFLYILSGQKFRNDLAIVLMKVSKSLLDKTF